MRILIIEDDQLVSRSIELMLGSAGIQHETTAVGETGVELARTHHYDAILLDLTLSDCHGYEVLRRLRGVGVDTPVLVLTGDGGLESKVAGLNLGADDYVTKPFRVRELLARFQALARRSLTVIRPVVVTGKLSIDLAARDVVVAGRRVYLTSKEYSILELLSLHKGMTLAKELIMAHLYGGHNEPELKIIDLYVCKLRKKLAAAGIGAGYIETVWGRGYTLRDPETRDLTMVEAA